MRGLRQSLISIWHLTWGSCGFARYTRIVHSVKGYGKSDDPVGLSVVTFTFSITGISQYTSTRSELVYRLNSKKTTTVAFPGEMYVLEILYLNSTLVDL